MTLLKPQVNEMNRGSVSVVATAQSCSSLLPTRGLVARLSRPRAAVCKFPAHKNYAVTYVSAVGFEPGVVWFPIQHAINCATTPHQIISS